MKKIRKLIKIVPLLLPLLLNAQELRYYSHVLTFICDRPDSVLLLDANEELRRLDLVFGSITNLRVQDSIVTHFYFSRQLAAGSLPDAPMWSGGLARKGRDIHIYDQDKMQWQKTLSHELAHTILAQNDRHVPVWFNEGLAQVFADEWTWKKYTLLGDAKVRKQILPLAEIEYLFGFNRYKAQLAYAQSMHAFRFMLDYYGDGVLPALLQETELSFADHFIEITGETIADFEIAWRDHLQRSYWFFGFTRFPGILWTLMPLVLILGYYLRKRQNKLKMDRWEAEETAVEPPRYEA